MKPILIFVGLALLVISLLGWREARERQLSRGKPVGPGAFVVWLFVGALQVLTGTTVGGYGAIFFWIGLICLFSGAFR